MANNEINKAWFDGIIDPLAEQKLFVESVLPLLEETFGVFWQNVMMGQDVNITPVDDAALEWIKDYAFELAVGVTATTVDALRAMMQMGYDEGDGIEQMAKRVREVFAQASRYRSFMIARTETTNAANMGSMSAAQRAGMKTKTWYAAVDERVCPMCGELHMMKVPIDEAFPNGVLAPSAHPNCRCTLLFEEDEE